jgi:hypothetical protein
MGLIRNLKEPYKSMALANQKVQSNISNLDIDLGDMPEQGGFLWATTPEGDDFWIDVNAYNDPKVKTKSHYPGIFPNEFKIGQIILYLPTMGLFKYEGYYQGEPKDCVYLNKYGEISMKTMEINSKNFNKFRPADKLHQNRYNAFVTTTLTTEINNSTKNDKKINNNEKSIIKINRTIPTISSRNRPSGTAIRGRSSRITIKSRCIVYNASIIKS